MSEKTAFVSGKFVHVVGSIDLVSGEGKLRYVHPTKVAGPTPVHGHTDVELVALDADNRELYKVNPETRLPSCDGEGTPTVALIQQDIPYSVDMRAIALLYRGVVKARYQGAPREAEEAGLAGAASRATFKTAPQGRKLFLASDEAAAGPAPGVSFTVQVRPYGTTGWNTIAVDRASPSVEIDPNQFPGVRSATVRVLRSNGFEENLFAEQEVDFSNLPPE